MFLHNTLKIRNTLHHCHCVSPRGRLHISNEFHSGATSPKPRLTKMRGLIHNQTLQTMTLRDGLPLPQRMPEEHLLRVECVGVTNGEIAWPRPLFMNECYPGIEMAGTVAEAPGNSKFPVGSRVYLRTTPPRWGSAREYSLGLESEMARQPDNLTSADAASVPVSALTAWQALFVHGRCSPLFDRGKRASPERRERVLITGSSGSVGLWMVQLAHLAGLHVTGLCSTHNMATVKQFGADEIINYTNTTMLQWSRTNPHHRFDLVLDCVGGNIMTEAWHAVREHGRVVSVATPPDMVWRSDLQRPPGASDTISGKFFIMESSGEHLQQITKLIEAGMAKPVVDSIYDLDEYQQAFDRMNSRTTVGKVVIRIAD